MKQEQRRVQQRGTIGSLGLRRQLIKRRVRPNPGLAVDLKYRVTLAADFGKLCEPTLNKRDYIVL